VNQVAPAEYRADAIVLFTRSKAVFGVECGVRVAVEQERDAYGARVAELYRELEAARTHIAEPERELAKCRG
jgi:Tfp pilus assembly protein FimV